MTPLVATLRRIVEDLDAQPHPWALVGGLAVSARTEPRMTRDIDVAVTVSDDRSAEGFVWGLSKVGYVPTAAVEQTETERLATIRLQPPMPYSGGVIVDLLFASSGIEAELVGRASRLEIIDGLDLPVAGVGDLIALKVLSRDDETRPQDAMDLRALCKEATAGDLRVARDALALIMERGFNRGRALDVLFSQALESSRKP